MLEAVKVEAHGRLIPLTALRRILDSFGRIGAGVRGGAGAMTRDGWAADLVAACCGQALVQNRPGELDRQ